MARQVIGLWQRNTEKVAPSALEEGGISGAVNNGGNGTEQFRIQGGTLVVLVFHCLSVGIRQWSVPQMHAGLFWRLDR